MYYTPLYTTSTWQTLVAHNDSQSRSNIQLGYDDMFYEYVDDTPEHHRLSPQQVATAYQRATEAPASLSSGTSETWSTTHDTIEEENDLPKVHPIFFQTEEEMLARVAALWPTEGPEDYEDTDWSIALSTYDFLGLEEGKHATTRVRIPYKVLDHLPEVLEEMEQFAVWWDTSRKGDHVVDPTVIAIGIMEIHPLEDRPRRLFEEVDIEVESDLLLDGILGDLRGLKDVVV